MTCCHCSSVGDGTQEAKDGGGGGREGSCRGISGPESDPPVKGGGDHQHGRGGGRGEGDGVGLLLLVGDDLMHADVGDVVVVAVNQSGKKSGTT